MRPKRGTCPCGNSVVIDRQLDKAGLVATCGHCDMTPAPRPAPVLTKRFVPPVPVRGLPKVARLGAEPPTVPFTEVGYENDLNRCDSELD